MADLVVIVPSRGRPDAAAELIEAFRETQAAADLVFAVDEDDQTADGYEEVVHAPGCRADKIGFGVFIHTVDPVNMVYALNQAARSLARPPFAVGFMGDDHRPRTKGWDAAYLDALRELGTGIVYGDDLLQGERLPTQCAMTSDIVRALGHMAPPPLTHLYVDDYWRDLGRAAGCLRYLPDVVVEHVHPIATGTPRDHWDEGHQRVNTTEMYDKDRRAYEAYRANRFFTDVQTVRQLRGAR